jgi:hypothetical protein
MMTTDNQLANDALVLMGPPPVPVARLLQGDLDQIADIFSDDDPTSIFTDGDPFSNAAPKLSVDIVDTGGGDWLLDDVPRYQDGDIMLDALQRMDDDAVKWMVEANKTQLRRHKIDATKASASNKRAITSIIGRTGNKVVRPYVERLFIRIVDNVLTKIPHGHVFDSYNVEDDNTMITIKTMVVFDIQPVDITPVVLHFSPLHFWYCFAQTWSPNASAAVRKAAPEGLPNKPVGQFAGQIITTGEMALIIDPATTSLFKPFCTTNRYIIASAVCRLRKDIRQLIDSIHFQRTMIGSPSDAEKLKFSLKTTHIILTKAEVCSFFCFVGKIHGIYQKVFGTKS